MYRTHNCGELSLNQKGEKVTLSGWVQKIRNKGFIIWNDLRDRYGITQLVFDNDRTSKEVYEKAQLISIHDYNEKKVKEIQSKIKDLCLHCDVRNKNSVRKAFKIISEQYGGIDILISNAGTAISGPIAEVDDRILRESFEDNFFSHQNFSSETIKIMKKQNTQGCLLFNISKQSVNPGKNFGPYGLPKTALLSLCKQYAIDYGSLGIRSNGVNADRIRSGLLNDGMIKSRAKAREVSTDEYMRGNLLLNEVKAEDVAKAFFHLAVSKKTTGAVLTVDGGNIAASLR